jgi:hypothetical protein
MKDTLQILGDIVSPVIDEADIKALQTAPARPKARRGCREEVSLLVARDQGYPVPQPIVLGHEGSGSILASEQN